MSSDPTISFMALEDMMTGFVPNRRGRKPAPKLPVIHDSTGAVIPQYLTEKYLGIRRENGALKLKKLTHRHLKIIGMHLEGMSVERIAHTLPCTIATVSRVLNDPLSQNILRRVYNDREGEIQALGGKAIQTVRDGLSTEQPMNTRLRAVSAYAKVRDVMLPKDAANETAEDVISRMLSHMSITGQNVQINIDASRKRDE